jgi:hypothetical protein
MLRGGQSLAKELLGRCRVPSLRQIEIDGGAGGIDRPLEVGPPSSHAHVGSSTRQEPAVRRSSRRTRRFNSGA